MSGYCNSTSDLKQWGPYINASVPITSDSDWGFYVDKIYHEINTALFKAGVIGPVVATFTSGAARLKYLNALGAVAEICKGLTTRGDPTGAKKENIGKQLREEFDTLLGGTEKYKDGYCDWPDSILAEEVAAGTDVSSAFTGDKIIKPDSNWNTVTDLDGTEPTFTVSDQW